MSQGLRMINYRKVKKIAFRTCNILNIPNYVLNELCEHKIWRKTKIIKKITVMALLIQICRKNNIERSIKQLAKISDLSFSKIVRSMSKCKIKYRKKPILHNKFRLFCAINNIEFKEIGQYYFNLIKKDDGGKFTSKKPNTIYGAILIKIGMDENKVVEITNIGKNTLLKTKKLLDCLILNCEKN